MTCIFGMATSTAAVLAADTRLNLAFRDASRGGHDSGPVEFTYPDGRAMNVDARFRKIRPIPRGWAAGARAFPLIHLCLGEAERTGCRDIAALHKALRSVYHREAARVFEDFPGLADQIGRTTIFCTCVRDNRFSLHMLPLNTGTSVPAQSDYVFVAPVELPDSTRQELVALLQEKLEAPADLPAVYRLLRLVAEVFHTVHAESTSVSDIVELGILLNADDQAYRLYAQNPNAGIMESTDTELQATLSSV